MYFLSRYSCIIFKIIKAGRFTSLIKGRCIVECAKFENWIYDQLRSSFLCFLLAFDPWKLISWCYMYVYRYQWLMCMSRIWISFYANIKEDYDLKFCQLVDLNICFQNMPKSQILKNWCLWRFVTSLTTWLKTTWQFPLYFWPNVCSYFKLCWVK